jgi:hypothetical protein
MFKGRCHSAGGICDFFSYELRHFSDGGSRSRRLRARSNEADCAYGEIGRGQGPVTDILHGVVRPGGIPVQLVSQRVHSSATDYVMIAGKIGSIESPDLRVHRTEDQIWDQVPPEPTLRTI